jgi:hypothetical protein
MPMIDVYASAGTIADPHSLAADLAGTLMRIEQVPDIPMFRQNTAAFIHELPDGAISNVDGESKYVRVQVLTNAGALVRDKQLAVVEQFTDLVVQAAGDPEYAKRVWVLLTEAADRRAVGAEVIGLMRGRPPLIPAKRFLWIPLLRLQAEGRILVVQQQEVGLHPKMPPVHAKAKVLQ